VGWLTTEWSRRIVFWIEIAYLVILGVLGWLYLTDGLPSWIQPPTALGPMPIGVPWYGAVGGVLISLTGVFEHRYDWDSRHFFWHLARPFIGAAVAVVAVLTVQAGILATGLDPGATNTTRTQDLFYYVAAFLVGYREESFRGIIKRVADVILTSDTEGTAPVVLGTDPIEGAVGSEVTIKGSGFKGTQMVRFGLTESPQFRITSDAEIIAEVPAGEGTVAVTVLNTKGASTAAQAFTITAPPA
jgi:hypothetical protein